MKAPKLILRGAALCGFALLTTIPVSAQVEVKSTTTTSTIGTVTEFGGDSLVIRSETSPEPIRYSYSKTTTYVDETGAPVSMETVKSGLPVTVYYVKENDRMVANKVVVRKKKTTTVEGGAVTTVGTISEFSPDTIVVRSETSPEPIRYSYSKTTTYVDEAGEPVSIETVKSGLPVSVQYTKVGDRMVASKVIVKKAIRPAAPVIQEKKTTTTTTTTTDK